MVGYAMSLVRKHGMKGLCIKVIEKKHNSINKDYAKNWRKYQVGEAELEEQREDKTNEEGPLVSVVVPCYRTPERFLREMISSVQTQTYQNWELILADASDSEDVSAIVLEYAKEDARIRYFHLEKNLGIAGNTNQGFEKSSGDYIALLDHDDLLTPNALYEMVRMLRVYPKAKFLYSDEDKTDADNTGYFEPHIKPEFNEELLNHYNYICHFVMFHKDLLIQFGLMDSAYDGAQDYEFFRRCTEAMSQDEIVHVNKILYHWRVHQGSTARFSGDKDYAYDAWMRTVQEHWDRVGVSAVVQEQKGHEYVMSDRKQNQSVEYVALCGEHIVPMTKDWEITLSSYLSERAKPIGMVGGKLLNKTGRRVVSAGYTCTQNGEVSPLFEGLRSYERGYFRRAAVPQDVAGVDMDFCVVNKRLYEELGINRELPKPQCYMDFSRRMRKVGYRVVTDNSVCARVK